MFKYGDQLNGENYWENYNDKTEKWENTETPISIEKNGEGTLSPTLRKDLKDERCYILRIQTNPTAKNSCYYNNEKRLYNVNEFTAKITNTNNASDDTSDSDSFKLRKCDISAEMYISKVAFKNTSTTAKDNSKNENYWNALTPRENRDSEEKEESPAYIEKGDYVEYTVKVKNNRNEAVYNTNLGDNYNNWIKPEITLTLPCKSGTEVTVNNNKKVNVDSSKHIVISLNNNDEVKGSKVSLKVNDGKGINEKDNKNTLQFTVRIPTDESVPYISSNDSKSARVRISGTQVGTTGCDVQNRSTQKNDYDYFQAKEYDASADTYVSAVSFKNNYEKATDIKDLTNADVYKQNGDDSTSWTANQENKTLTSCREKKLNTDKKNSPAYVEKGDIVTAQVRVSNSIDEFNPDVKRDKSPYFYPSNIYADIKITLPDGCKVYSQDDVKKVVYSWNNADGKNCLTELSSGNVEISSDGKTITIKNHLVNAGTANSTYFVFRTDEINSDNVSEIKAEVTKIVNVNGIEVQNNAKSSVRKNDDGSMYNASKEYLKAKNYKVNVDKYITGLTRKDGKQIYDNEFIADNYDFRNATRSNLSVETKKNNPVHIENGDIVEYTLKVSYTGTLTDKIKFYIKDVLPSEISLENIEYTMKLNGNTLVLDEKGSPYYCVKIQQGSSVKYQKIEDIGGSNFVTPQKIKEQFTAKVENNGFEITNGALLKFKSGDSIEIKIKVPIGVAKENTGKLLENKLNLTKIENINGNTVENDEIRYVSEKPTNSDYVYVKQYDAPIDTYISAVQFKNGTVKNNSGDQYWTKRLNLDVGISEVNLYRSKCKNVDNSNAMRGSKSVENNEAYIEKGDYVIYTIDVSNTPTKRVNSPYVYTREIVTADIKIESIPTGCELYSDSNFSNKLNVGSVINVNNIYSGSYASIQVYLKTDGVSNRYNDLQELKATVVKITNINNCEVYNKATETIREVSSTGVAIPYSTSSDYFRVKEYNASIDTYISSVQFKNGTVKNNIGDQYWTGITRSRQPNGTKSYTNNEAYIEKGDYVTYTLEVANTNNSIDKTISRDSKTYKNPSKIATEVTINKIPDNCELYSNSNFSNRLYVGSKINITDILANSNGSIQLYLKTDNVSNLYKDLQELNVSVTKVTNINGCEGYNTAIEEIREKTSNGTSIFYNTSSDYFRVKEYNIAIDKYISKVEHAESRGGASVTYNGESRRSNLNDNNSNPKNDPVYVEYGDKVTYTIRVYNTTDDAYYNVGRKNGPYRNPSAVKVDLKDLLPENVSDIKINDVNNYTRNGRDLSTEQLYIEPNQVKTITVTLIVNEAQTKYERYNTIEVLNFKNRNGYNINNNGKKTTSSDKYILNNYDASVDAYISEYYHEMADYNYNHNFITKDAYDNEIQLGTRHAGFEYNRKNNPLKVEKYETFEYTTIVRNSSNAGESEDNIGSYGKYSTRVRPSQVTQTLDYGLSLQNVTAVWHHANGVNEDITSRINYASERNTNNKKNIYTFIITDDNIILSPGEYITYTTVISVTESNMSLNDLACRSEIKTLTNVNKNTQNDRIVTEQNENTQTSNGDYVRLKDLVIAGNVWLDNNKDGYNNDNANYKNIVVRLYGNNTSNNSYTKVAEVRTDENGFYTFGRQWKAPKDGNGNYTSNSYIKYYVEFEYDGLKYKPTEIYGGDSDGEADGMQNLGGKAGSSKWRQGYGIPGTTSGKTEYMIDSNAYEFSDKRNTFNQIYQTIGYNKAYGENVTNTIEYTKDGHVSKLNNNSSRKMTARSFIKKTSTGTEESVDNTNTLFLTGYKYSNTSPETEYLKFINLGLVTRDELDLSLDVDVYSVKTTINGEEMTYEFDPYNGSYVIPEDKYNLDLYQADYNYRYDNYYSDNTTLKDYKNQASEQDVEVTYRITVKNNKIDDNIPVDALINELVIYYDENFMTYDGNWKQVKNKYLDSGIFYTADKYKVKLNNGSKMNILTDSKYPCYDLKNKSGYQVLYLSTTDGNDYISEDGSKTIDITFTVNKDNARNLKIGDLDLIAEIGAYTTKYSDQYENQILKGKFAGLVDSDSNPGNLGLQNGINNAGAGIEDTTYYEDDTYKANINIKVPGLNNNNPGSPLKRSITGFVWDDTRSESVGTAETGIQYLGNGEYNANDKNNENAKTNPYDKGENKDKPIKGVKVSLIEIAQKANGEYYEHQAKDSKGNIIQAITDENGKYTLEDYIPGYYIVRFDYGYDANNVLYNGQDYKSTKYHNNNYYNCHYTGSYNGDNIASPFNYKYFNFVKSELSNPNYSDAQDDEIRRLNVNSYSETMTSEQAKVFSDIYNFKNTLTNNTHMYADSTIFYVNPEEVDSDKTSIKVQDKFNETRLWKLSNLDFGLEYRPESSIILDKNIDNIELVTSDNKTLAKIYFKEDEDGNRVVDESKSKGNENVQFLPNSQKTQQGFVYINMDSDILEGCTIKVDYQMDSENNSEVDRINQNLDGIRFEVGANDYTGTYKVFVNSGSGYNYSANGTAAEFLEKQYYKKDGNNCDYLTKLKKPYNSNGETKVNNVTLAGTGYYGMYLGQTYYTGFVGDKDVVASLKVDNILDYIDNDFTFDLSENSTTNRLWKTTTSKDLYDNRILDFEKVNKNNNNLIDRDGIRYDTENRSNLALSVDSNKNGTVSTGNESLSRFLTTVNAAKDKKDYVGTINAIASKVLSPEDISKGTGLNYENIAEIVQYTSLTGRRTTLPEQNGGGGIIGNANVSNWTGYGDFEDDTDASEIITISPPTGLTK